MAKTVTAVRIRPKLKLTPDPAARARMAVTGHSEVRARYAEPIITDQMEQYLLESARGAFSAA